MTRLCKALLLTALAVVLVMPPLASYGQQSYTNKEKLFRALRERQLLKRDLKLVVKTMQLQGVPYQLSDADEQEIRRLGGYLGKQGLDDLVVAIRNNYHSTAQASSWQLSGKILDEQKPYILKLGGDYIPVTGEALKRGINLADIINRFFNYRNQKLILPVKIYQENNRLLVDAEIHNEKQDLLCSIVRDDWQFNPDGKYDRNYTNNAFEVVDGNLLPVLQIYLEESNKIYVGGLFYTDQGTPYYFTPQGTAFNARKQDIIPHRLFKYPSRENIGKLEVENLPSFKEYDEDVALSQKIDSNKLKYSQLTNEALKLKATSLINELRQLYQISWAQFKDDENRNRMSPEAQRQVMKAIREAKSPEEREKALQPLKEQQEREIEKYSQTDQAIAETYKQKMQLDVILIRDEILRRLKQVPKRMHSPAVLDWHYKSGRGFALETIIGDLQLLTESLH